MGMDVENSDDNSESLRVSSGGMFNSEMSRHSTISETPMSFKGSDEKMAGRCTERSAAPNMSHKRSAVAQSITAMMRDEAERDAVMSAYFRHNSEEAFAPSDFEI